jgi:hypothetical protein
MTSGGVVILNGKDKFSILKEVLYERGEGTLVRSPVRIAASEQFNIETLPSIAIHSPHPAMKPVGMG